MYVPSAGEAARYKAKALVTDNTLLEVCSADAKGLLISLQCITTNQQKSATMATSNLKFGMSMDIISMTKAFIRYSCNTDVNTTLNAIHVHVDSECRCKVHIVLHCS